MGIAWTAPLRKLSVVLAVGGTLLLAAPSASTATVAAHPLVGIGDENVALFSDPRFLALGITQVRFDVSWDVLSSGAKDPYRRNVLAAWLADARGLGLTPLITFDHSDRPGGRLPSVAQYSKAFLLFHRLYPWVTDFATWNEANYYGEPTASRPKRVAEYYLALRKDCPSCTILAAELLDDDNPKVAVPDVRWAREFVRYAHRQPAYWGLHNYVSANHLSAASTRQLLAAVTGNIWLTETGGILRFPHRGNPGFALTAAHQAKVDNFLLNTLPRISPRIQRVYLYEWRAPAKPTTWDSALIAYDNRPRQAYDVLANTLAAWGIEPNCAISTLPPACDATSARA
jgi:hypothetical protein